MVAHFPGSIVVISRLKLQCSVGIFTFYINNFAVPARLAVMNLGVIIIFIILARVVTYTGLKGYYLCGNLTLVRWSKAAAGCKRNLGKYLPSMTNI